MSNTANFRIGPYEIESQIGRGNMATVYRAFQPQLGRWVAVKVLGHHEDAEFLQRFRQEAQAVAALRHPNILMVHDYGEEQGEAYLVMEYVAGGTLKTRLTGRPMSWPEAARFIIPIGQALAYAHSLGIVHRDIKPANILLPQPDWPLLADFGLVKMMGGQQNITRPGTILGTPAYFAPEQIMGGGTDARGDIYSLAIVLYELLTGSLPLFSPSPIELLQRRLQESPPPLSQIISGIPPQLEMVVMRALDRNPGTRYQQMSEFIEALSMVPGATGRVLPNTAVSTDSPATAMLGKGTAVVGPRLIVLGTGAVLALSAHQPTTLGRGSTQTFATAVLDLEPHGGSQAGVSRHHARIYRTGTQWFIEDLNSTNGTFVNEKMLTPGQPTPLLNSSQVRCSRLILIFYES